MMKGYTFLPHTADVMFEARGKTVEELFKHCALATEETMVDLKTVKAGMIKEIVLKEKTIEQLLYSFLEELIFLKDAEQLIFKTFKIAIKKNAAYTLTAICSGEKINQKKHALRDDVKAVTMHQFEVKQEKKGWKARMILDV